LKKHQQIITKNLAANLLVLEDNEAYMSYTSTIDGAEIELLNNDIYPSFFQKQIEKEYEVRSYYLDGEIYSMAIFSQNDSQTKVHFRQYNLQKPNRNIPYKLPNKVEEQIRNMMNSLKINSGSLDFIKEKDGELLFLEINPLGQFGMTSYPCNYYLEKKIAEYLIMKDNENQ
jgi:ATP-GRASP peptide maturase of grasp-with-spasm system